MARASVPEGQMGQSKPGVTVAPDSQVPTGKLLMAL